MPYEIEDEYTFLYNLLNEEMVAHDIFKVKLK